MPTIMPKRSDSIRPGLILSLLLLAGSGVAATDPAVAARVNDAPIFESEIQARVNQALPAGQFHGRVSPEKLAQYRARALQDAINDELIFQEAERRKLTMPQAELEAKFQGLPAATKGALSEKSLRQGLTRQWLIAQLQEREITAQSRVSPEDARRYFSKHPDEFVRPELAQVRHLLLALPPPVDPAKKAEKKKLAEALLKRAKAGEDLAGLCRQYSGDRYAAQGGDLGWVHRGRLEPEVEQVVFKLEPGAFGPVIETVWGFHLVRVEGREPSRPLSFAEAQEPLTRRLEQEKETARRQAWLTELKARARIETY